VIVGVSVGVGVMIGVSVGVGVMIGVSVGVGVMVGVSVGVGVGVRVGVPVGVLVRVGIGVKVGVGIVWRWGFCLGAAQTPAPKDSKPIANSPIMAKAKEPEKVLCPSKGFISNPC
jgi:hypothetical protein